MSLLQKINCSICAQPCTLLDVVDFNKTCEEQRGKFLPICGIPIYYALCDSCGFCFAPEIAAWPMEEFEVKIYNEGYAEVDPDYVMTRPASNANMLHNTFSVHTSSIRHLDYGGGNGALSIILRQQGWSSSSYDPFVDREVDITSLGRFDLITVFEVFEHVPDVQRLMQELHTLLAPGGLILFSTLLSDGQIHKNARLSWWYASPRNGHISLFSRQSLVVLATQYGFKFGSFNPGTHVFCTTPPVWAAHVLKA